jgi:quercetin dioxygenase-like cupin family protein
MAAMVFGLYGAVETVEVGLEKPQALAGKAHASVQIRRSRSDFPRRREAAEFGEVEVLGENSEAGLYLLHVQPGRSIPAHYHRVMRELEWLAVGNLLRDGQPCVRGEPVVWTRGEVHRYDNVSETIATLFCCDTPPFIPSDEILAHERRSDE